MNPSSWTRELAQGLRLVRKQPSAALQVVCVLAVAIGVSAAVFAVADAVLLRPLPYLHADRLALL